MNGVICPIINNNDVQRFSILDSDDEAQPVQVAQKVEKPRAARPAAKPRGGRDNSNLVAEDPSETVVTRRAPRAARGGAARRGDGRRGGAEGGRPRRREKDRQSGTGFGKEIAKGGAGKANWGTTEDAIA